MLFQLYLLVMVGWVVSLMTTHISISSRNNRLQDMYCQAATHTKEATHLTMTQW